MPPKIFPLSEAQRTLPPVFDTAESTALANIVSFNFIFPYCVLRSRDIFPLLFLLIKPSFHLILSLIYHISAHFPMFFHRMYGVQEMNNNFRKKKCFDIYKETKDIGFVLLVFGAVTICAFFLPPKAWIILLGILLIICGFTLLKR